MDLNVSDSDRPKEMKIHVIAQGGVHQTVMDAVCGEIGVGVVEKHSNTFYHFT